MKHMCWGSFRQIWENIRLAEAGIWVFPRTLMPPNAPSKSIWGADDVMWFLILWSLSGKKRQITNPVSDQVRSVAQSCPTLCNPMNRSMPGLPVHHQLLEFTQTHVHQVSNAIQPSHPLSSPSPPAPNPSQHQRFFEWVSSLHEVAKVLEFQL